LLRRIAFSASSTLIFFVTCAGEDEGAGLGVELAEADGAAIAANAITSRDVIDENRIRCFLTNIYILSYILSVLAGNAAIRPITAAIAAIAPSEAAKPRIADIRRAR
jgi:hypothetical protein